MGTNKLSSVVKQNKKRDRVVPDDVLLLTHEGAAKTIWSILTGGLPKGLNGRIDVILNNRENTVMFKDSKGNEMEGAVKGFLSLPVKKQVVVYYLKKYGRNYYTRGYQIMVLRLWI